MINIKKIAHMRLRNFFIKLSCSAIVCRGDETNRHPSNFDMQETKKSIYLTDHSA